MITKSKRIACAEALAVYNLLDDEAKGQIPESFTRFIQDNAEKNIIVRIRPDIPLDLQFISMEGLKYIATMAEFISA